MAIDLRPEIRIQPIDYPINRSAGIALSILRLDEIHPLVSGNKWFKLQEYIRLFREGAYDFILTFGGAHSNHLIATAAACAALGIPCRAWVRGFHGQAAETATLNECRKLGMELHFVGRDAYSRHDEIFLLEVQGQYPTALIIPEGGYGPMGIAGAAAITNYIPAATELVCCAIGSGTTFCGITNGLLPHQSALGFTVFKQGATIAEELQAQIPHQRWALATDYHFGKFARHTPELIDFIRYMQEEHALPLDFVYNAKMLWGLLDMIKQDKVAAQHILCIHTGGLQGNRSIAHLLEA
ncbi:D-cysteine desulfhydrase [compost metagenome]